MSSNLEPYSLIEQLPIGLGVWHLADLNDYSTFELVAVNAMAKQILGLPPEIALTETAKTLLLSDPFPAFLKMEPIETYAQIIHTQAKKDLGEIRYRDKQAAEKVFLVKAFPLTHQQLGILFEDITERKQTEEALHQSEQRRLFYVQQTTLAMIEWSTNFRVVEWNSAAEKLFGHRRTDALGRHVTELVMSANSFSEISQTWNNLIKTKTGISNIIDNITVNNTSITCEWHNTPLTDEMRNVIGVTSLILDVTDRKRTEQELEQYNLRLKQSNRELQDFASVASHDLQEPLRKIQAFGDRLKTRCADTLPPEAQDYLDRMQNAAGRMQMLINDLLSFSRVTTKAQPFKAVDLTQIVQEVLSDLEIRIQQVGGTVQLEPLPTIDADPLQMRQLFQNLISNALKFHQPDIAPIIQIQSLLEQNQTRAASATNSSIASCQIKVSDNGIGFDEKYLDRIFTVFQRLHSRTTFEGTGVGLAICRKIVERHNGSITAKSSLGEGATFIVTLPLRQADSVAS